MGEILKSDNSMKPEEVGRDELNPLKQYLASRAPVNLGKQLVTLPNGEVVKQATFYNQESSEPSTVTEEQVGYVALGLDFHYQHAPDRNPQVFRPFDTTD